MPRKRGACAAFRQGSAHRIPRFARPGCAATISPSEQGRSAAFDASCRFERQSVQRKRCLGTNWSVASWVEARRVDSADSGNSLDCRKSLPLDCAQSLSLEPRGMRGRKLQPACREKVLTAIVSAYVATVVTG